MENGSIPIIQIEEQFRIMADTAPVMIWISGVDKLCYFFNAGWLRFTGRTQEEEYGNGWAEGVHPDDLERCLEIYVGSFDARAEFKMEYRLKRHDGQYRWLLDHGVSRYAPDGAFAGYIGSCIDITELKEDEIRKNDFIGMVSHELKTPLTSLNALLQVAQAKLKTNEDTFLRSGIEKAVNQVKKMGTMINGFLNVSRLESGKITIDKQHFNLGELVSDIIEETELSLSVHEIHFIPCEAVTVYADRDKIGSVMANLLSNAVKYSPKGKRITVNCKVEENTASVSVKDDGMGIAPHDVKKLFDRYYRVESKQTRHISGFGIGLYLCAEIMEWHGGKIWVESELGKGSTFFFSLPLT